jgi:phosphoribosylformylglycinamidine cyclo-ligase
MSKPSSHASAYARAGVDLTSGETTLRLIKDAVVSTYTANVLAGIGSFGGLFDVSFLKAYNHPVLVASTDGVGTKTLVAAALNRFDTIGIDIVNHCINDILVQGATPLFFLDYLASSRLEPAIIAQIVTGMARACRETETVLLGGETAEMPGVYQDQSYDIVGTIIGVAEKSALVTGETITTGDKVLALMSGGLQTNGYSLARQVMARRYHDPCEDTTVGEALLKPHRHYLSPIRALMREVTIKGMAHITGGGIPGNLPRILPAGLGAQITLGSWPMPEIFRLIATTGDIDLREMYDVFNMGAGFLLIVAPEDERKALQVCPEPLYPIGHITQAEGVQLEHE